jgi:hypothetical protein
VRRTGGGSQNPRIYNRGKDQAKLSKVGYLAGFVQ